MALVEGWSLAMLQIFYPECLRHGRMHMEVPIKFFTPVTKSERSGLAGGRAFLGQFQSVVS